jgi:CRISPR-associated protein Cas5d
MIYDDASANDLAYYTYLKNPEYEVKVHFEWNQNRPDLEQDRNENKHFQVLKRSIEAGGRRDIFLGTRECQGYVESLELDDFGKKPGFYDDYPGEIDFGVMLHGISYPDETGNDELEVRLWRPKCVKGIVQFIRPEDCTVRRMIKKSSMKIFNTENVNKVDDEYSELIGGE